MNRSRESRNGFGYGLTIALVGALLLATSSLTRAAVFEDLYTVSVGPDMSLPASQRQADAMRRGMALLLTRITGFRAAEQVPELAELIRNADRYRDLYIPLSADEVRISFRRTPLNEALTRSNMPYWGDERPATLLWLAIDLGNGERAELGQLPDSGGPGTRQLQGTASYPLSEQAAAAFEEITTDVLRAADERGLPVQLPNLDAVDRQHVRFADVWGGFDRPVARAAERYDVDAILIGRVRMAGDEPEVHWTLRRGETVRGLSDPELRAGVDWLADQLAAEYSIIGGASLTAITIHDIMTYEDYGRVRQYLESLSLVEAVYEESLSTTGELRLRLLVRGDNEQLRSVLMLGGVLRAPVDPVPDGGSGRFVVGAGSSGFGQQRELVFRPSWLGPADDPDRL